MLSAGEWKKSQSNTVLFVMVDLNGHEVEGLSTTFDLYISKGGATFAVGLGSKAEVGHGWYSYTSTPLEANTPGPIAVYVTGVGCLQQNLEYIVQDRVITAIDFEYVVTSTAGNVPLSGVSVYIYSDNLGTNLIWTGITDTDGIARDEYGFLPRLEPGTYYFLRDKAGYAFDNYDVEVVS